MHGRGQLDFEILETVYRSLCLPGSQVTTQSGRCRHAHQFSNENVEFESEFCGELLPGGDDVVVTVNQNTVAVEQQCICLNKHPGDCRAHPADEELLSLTHGTCKDAGIEDRITLGRMQNPVRGFLHGTAAVTAVVGTVFLVIRTMSLPGRIAMIVYGLGLLALYTTSSLYHSIPWTERGKKRMQRLDHAMIFVLIAATFTPIAAIVLDGWMRAVSLGVAWTIALTGVSHHIFIKNQRFHLSIGLMVTLGWLSVPLMFPLADRAGMALVVLIGLGGLIYTVGMVIVVTQRPRLWPRLFSSHELFHVLVVTASALHFTAILKFVVPLTS